MEFTVSDVDHNTYFLRSSRSLCVALAPQTASVSQFVLPGLQMLQYVAGHPRDPDTADESYAFVKYSKAKTGFRRQESVTRAFDEHGRMVPPSTIPHLFER
jgi:hypothetical protein